MEGFVCGNALRLVLGVVGVVSRDRSLSGNTIRFLS